MTETLPNDGPNRSSKFGTLAILSLLIASPSFGIVQKYMGLPGVAAYFAGVVVFLLVVLKTSPWLAPWCRRHFKPLYGLCAVVLIAGFAIIHPIEDGKGPGKSSDRDEGLNMAVIRMSEGETPYYPANTVAGPLSVLPGSILLAAPFVALGDSSYQNIFWLLLFLCVAAWFFRDHALALYLLAIPLALSPSVLHEFISGGDLITNAIFISCCSLATIRAWTNESGPLRSRWLFCILLGFCIASRANFVLLVPLVGAAIWRTRGLGEAILAGTIITVTVAALTLPFYLHDPAGFTPLLTKNKLSLGAKAIPWASTVMIGITAVVSIICSFYLLLRRHDNTLVTFLRCCTLVTATPIVCAILFSTAVSGQISFAILRERFGIMYLFFGLLGWGATYLASPEKLSEKQPSPAIH